MPGYHWYLHKICTIRALRTCFRIVHQPIKSTCLLRSAMYRVTSTWILVSAKHFIPCPVPIQRWKTQSNIPSNRIWGTRVPIQIKKCLYFYMTDGSSYYIPVHRLIILKLQCRIDYNIKPYLTLIHRQLEFRWATGRWDFRRTIRLPNMPQDTPDGFEFCNKRKKNRVTH